MLPSLGESDAQLSTITALKPAYHVSAPETREVARLKGDARMAQVVRRALRDREHPLARNVTVMVDGNVLRLTRDTSTQIVERARRQAGSHNAKRPRVVRAVVDHLRDQYRRSLGVAAPDDVDWDRELDDRLRRLPEVRAALERMWPVLTGGELIHDLFSFPALVRSAADGILSRDQQALLVRDRAASLGDVPWSDADLPLIDEADALLGPPEAARPRRRRARRSADDVGARVVSELGVGGFLTGSEVARRYRGDVPSDEPPEEPRTFGHVVVDEAQDLSAMQWRMLGRRCPSGSMTVVGDFGQASLPGALQSWDEVLHLLPRRAEPRVVTLSVNYRTPAEIMDVAQRVLAAAAPRVEPTRAVRHTGDRPRFVAVRGDGLVDAVAEEARRAVQASGTVAVLAPAAHHAALVERLADLDARAGTGDALDAPVAILTAGQAKGLEFDHVVLVEPRQLVTDDRPGLRLLYVAMTRATRGLAIVHAEPLPEVLAAAALPGAPLAAS